MILPITKYGHPVLRKKGARIETITPAIKKLVADMFDTMASAHGVGLAAQQVGHALQLMVIDVRGVDDRPSSLWLNDQPAEVEGFMPLALLNPELKLGRQKVEGPEGCLSFPEIYAEIHRSETTEVCAMDAEGKSVQFRCEGLLSRAIQHEMDHLNGILFVDRMNIQEKLELKPQLDDLYALTQTGLAKV